MRFLVILFSAVAMAMVNANAVAADTSGKVLRHVVMYKFKETTTPAQVQEVVDAFAGLPKKIDTIISAARMRLRNRFLRMSDRSFMPPARAR